MATTTKTATTPPAVFPYVLLPDVDPGYPLENAEALSIPEIDGFYDDGEEFEEQDPSWLPPPDPTPPSVLQGIKKTYVRPLVPLMDLFGLSLRGLHAIVLALCPNDAPSLSTIFRQVKEVRHESLAWVKAQNFPRRGVLHFDGVKVKMGVRQGFRRVEHLAVTVTGLGEEFKIGLFETRNGTGN